MKSIEDKLNRRIRELKLISAINESLIEHYETKRKAGCPPGQISNPHSQGGIAR